MSHLITIEERKRDVERSCLSGTIKRIEVLEPKLLRGADAGTLQNRLANHRIVDVQRKGKNLLFFTDAGQTLILSMDHDADLQCEAAPAFEHAPDARIIIHFDDGHTLDLRFPSLKDRFYFFPTTELKELDPIRDLGPEPQHLRYVEFRDRLDSKSYPNTTIHEALLDQRNLAGLNPELVDEICFQAGVRPDRKLGDLLRSEWESLFDRMQHVLKMVSLYTHDGHPEELDRLGFLMPRRGTTRGCPKTGETLQVLHFQHSESYFCPSCQPEGVSEEKKTGYW